MMYYTNKSMLSISDPNINILPVTSVLINLFSLINLVNRVYQGREKGRSGCSSLYTVNSRLSAGLGGTEIADNQFHG